MRKVVPATAEASVVWARLACHAPEPRRVGGEDRRLHRRVVHTRDGKAHGDGGDQASARGRCSERRAKGRHVAAPMAIRTESATQSLSYRDPPPCASPPCRCSACATMPSPMKRPLKQTVFQVRLAPADDVKADARDHDGEEKRQRRQREVVTDLHARHAERQHGDEVHRPDAAAHGDGGGHQPRVAGQPEEARMRPARSRAV